jgi:kynureninase
MKVERPDAMASPLPGSLSGLSGGGAAPAGDEQEALALDRADPLATHRRRFHLPIGPGGAPAIYFCGHSLGLQPVDTRAAVLGELDDWAALGVRAHFEARHPWYSYHERFRDCGARLVGAEPGEVVMMNSLTVNLHLMLATFYRPAGDRYQILVEDGAFPSDAYAVTSQIVHRGYDPRDALRIVKPRPGEHLLNVDDIEAMLDAGGRRIALVLLPGVHYLTGQYLDVGRIAAAARRHGCAVGFDLAHAAGNVALKLHDWEVDFAVWCSYKYLNAGPGAVAGCFVHARHGQTRSLPRLAGWWGNDPRTRFEMAHAFVPREGADGWQVSNPPILALAPLATSLEIFDEVGMEALRLKSERLTGYLERLICRIPAASLELLTPRHPQARGCQLSLRIPHGARGVARSLEAAGVVADFREPDVIRVAPVPLYNSFHEIWRFAQILSTCLGDRA